MIEIKKNKVILSGPEGKIHLNINDEIICKFGMLYEGECEGLGVTIASKKFNYTRQRYYQLLEQFKKFGALALKNIKTGPKTNYRRIDEVIRQIIRHRFLDPNATPAVIAQKLVQCGYKISIRSVERVITQYGLLKKTIYLSSAKRTLEDRNTSYKNKNSL